MIYSFAFFILFLKSQIQEIGGLNVWRKLPPAWKNHGNDRVGMQKEDDAGDPNNEQCFYPAKVAQLVLPLGCIQPDVQLNEHCSANTLTKRNSKRAALAVALTAPMRACQTGHQYNRDGGNFWKGRRRRTEDKSNCNSQIKEFLSRRSSVPPFL